MGYFLRTFKLLPGAMLLLLFTPQLTLSAAIAVTLPPLAGLITMLDTKAEILCLLGNGSDPHHFQLTPRKIEAMMQSELLIRASKDDAGWPLPPHHAHELDLWPDIDHGWLNPAIVRQVLPRLSQTLIKLHPQRQAAIEAALQDALDQTDSIEKAWRKALKPVQQAGVLMQHPSWRGLMLSMGVPVLDVLESGQHGHEYGPRQLEHALKTLNARPQAWMIAEHGHNNRALDWLQQHASHQTQRISLNGLGNCTQSWADLMRYNLNQINLDQINLNPIKPNQKNLIKSMAGSKHND
ncbi:MAG: zinc ABC transporter substrate-binding protein [Mariprofundus sp.]|nr:zinc ABC transporter substrate-binding protein [Mariprofundus sp.]